MKIVTSNDLKDHGISCTICNCPVLIGIESGKALEMGVVYSDDIQDIIKGLKKIIDDGNVLYLYESFDLKNMEEQNRKYVVRFCYEQKSSLPVIISKTKYQDFVNMWSEEVAVERIKKDLKLLGIEYVGVKISSI